MTKKLLQSTSGKMSSGKADKSFEKFAPGPKRDTMCGDAKCHLDREAKMVSVTPVVFCDPCISDIVSALNAGGVKTVASCCGHGFRPGSIVLDDGRELVIARSMGEARYLGRGYPDINGSLMRKAQETSE